METTININGQEFKVSNITAQRTTSYGHYKIGADINGTRHESTMNNSRLFDDMYGQNETQEELEAMEIAEKQVATIIICELIN